MNKRQVIILWVIALLLGAAVATVKISQNKETRVATDRVQGDTLFESFPADEVAAITIDGANGSVDLAKMDDKWVVKNRADYPANTTYVNNFLRSLTDLKVTLGIEAGPSFAPRFGMDESATTAEDRGLTARFKDSAGKDIATVSLGKTIDSGDQSPMGGGAVGRYVRNHADESGFYAVSEMFPSVSEDAKRWLADGFISPEKVKSIAVTKYGQPEIAWRLVRDGEEAEFKLDKAKDGEVVDTEATAPLKSLLSYARFEDVIPKDKVVGMMLENQTRTATIETYEGFTYTLNLTPTKAPDVPDEKPATNGTPPAIDNFLVTVDVTADLPTERKKEADEKPEDAKTKDTTFAERRKALAEKLEKEKAFAGVTFEVSKSTVEPLTKDRAALITKAEPAAANGTVAPPVQKFPGGMVATPPAPAPPAPGTATTTPVSATTPPVSATTPPIEVVTPPISVESADAKEKAEEPEVSEEEAAPEEPEADE